MNNLLIVKKGALGDVVRTSYFAGALKRESSVKPTIFWLTAPAAIELLEFNPYIDNLVTEIDKIADVFFDTVYSLDDEHPTLLELQKLNYARLTGAYLGEQCTPTYTDDSREWFDMGLLSKYGKAKADELKRTNTRSHAQIFCDIFGVRNVVPEFFSRTCSNRITQDLRKTQGMCIGINPFAGGRWKSKQLLEKELDRLIDWLLCESFCDQILLLGGGSDYQRNCSMAELFANDRLRAACTDASVLDLADAIAGLDLLVTSDSLALHLAVAQRVPIVAFFAPTSAAEIDTFGQGCKVLSTSQDYCSYQSDADNSSLTAERLMDAISEFLENKKPSPVMSISTD
jgi:heptosyltransferase-2